MPASASMFTSVSRENRLILSQPFPLDELPERRSSVENGNGGCVSQRAKAEVGEYVGAAIVIFRARRAPIFWRSLQSDIVTTGRNLARRSIRVPYNLKTGASHAQ